MSDRTSTSARAAKQARQGVFIDAVAGRHACTDPQQLLSRRTLTFRKEYGWTYDVWVDDAASYALAGANGRFSLQAMAKLGGDALMGGLQGLAQLSSSFATRHN